jgi:hypothetical protein
MSEDKKPRFKWIVAADASDCGVRYCVRQAMYWAIWDPDIKRSVCRVHKDTVQNKAWDEVMEIFRPARTPE